jgi:hypothetical protein
MKTQQSYVPTPAFTQHKNLKRKDVERFGFYHLVHEFIFSNSQREVERTLKLSSVEGFGTNLGRSLTLRLMESKMRLLNKSEEKVKFVATDIWISLFGRSVDKLQKVVN